MLAQSGIVNKPGVSRNRRPARVVALQALYELDCTQHPLEQVLTERLNENQIADEQRIFVYQLVNGILEHREAIDQLLQRFAPDWPLDQIAIVDRNILRIAIWEFAIFGDTPLKVAINEAVELAKEFGSESASRFVNGVLGALSANEAEVRARLERKS